MNQVAVVIGGGQTLGAFLCRGLAEEGYRVAVVDIQSDNVGRQLFLHRSEMLQTHRQVNNDAAYGRFGDFALR